MNRPLYSLIAAMALWLLSGCETFKDRRQDPKSAFVALNATDTVVFIGGNSEYSGGGLWARKYDMIADLAHCLGYGDRTSSMSRAYYSWTGDDPGNGSFLPSNLNYERGQERIADELQTKGYLRGSRIVLVAWSNGGKTAVQLSNLLAARGHTVSLLVTFDPVSTLTGGAEPGAADAWLDVYPRSGFWARFLSSNVIAWAGGAWNDIEQKGYASLKMNDCIVGNHSDVTEMWDRALISQAFRSWSEGTTGRPMTLPSRQFSARPDCPVR